MEVLLIDEPFIRIMLDPTSGILFMLWCGYQDSHRIETMGIKVIEFIEEHQVKKVICDNTNVEGPWFDASIWTRDVWFPAVFEKGVTHFAWVWSEDTFARLSAERSLPASIPGLKVFNDYNLALKWLEEPPS